MWPQLGSQSLPRMEPSWFQKLSKRQSNEIKKSIEKTLGIWSFLEGSESQVGQKIHQKSIQGGMKNKMRFWIDFGWLLDRFLIDVGPKLGGKLEPSCTKVEEKWIKKTMSRKVQAESTLLFFLLELLQVDYPPLIQIYRTSQSERKMVEKSEKHL